MDPDLIFEELVERIRENELRLLKRSGAAKQTTPTTLTSKNSPTASE